MHHITTKWNSYWKKYIWNRFVIFFIHILTYWIKVVYLLKTKPFYLDIYSYWKNFANVWEKPVLIAKIRLRKILWKKTGHKVKPQKNRKITSFFHLRKKVQFRYFWHNWTWFPRSSTDERIICQFFFESIKINFVIIINYLLTFCDKNTFLNFM